jgi:hypothetical protein
MGENVKLSKTMSERPLSRTCRQASVPRCCDTSRHLLCYRRACRFVDNPGPLHWGAAKRVLHYLKGSIGLKLIYSRTPSPDKFATFSDADLSGNPDNSRSTGGFAICVRGGVVQWGSRLQPHVSLSSTESEYTIASKVGCEVMWMRYFFGGIGYDMSRPSPLLLDNKSAIQVAKHPEHQSIMRHVHRAYHWLRDHVNHNLIAVSHVPGDLNPADIFTKPLDRFDDAHMKLVSDTVQCADICPSHIGDRRETFSFRGWLHRGQSGEEVRVGDLDGLKLLLSCSSVSGVG